MQSIGGFDDHVYGFLFAWQIMISTENIDRLKTNFESKHRNGQTVDTEVIYNSFDCDWSMRHSTLYRHYSSLSHSTGFNSQMWKLYRINYTKYFLSFVTNSTKAHNLEFHNLQNNLFKNKCLLNSEFSSSQKVRKVSSTLCSAHDGKSTWLLAASAIKKVELLYFLTSL